MLLTSFSCPLKVPMIIKDICSFGDLRLAFTSFNFFKQLYWMSWIGRNFPVMLTVKVAVFCLLLSILLIDTVFAPFGFKVYFPEEIYDSVWSRFRISSFGTSCSSIIDEIRLWNVSFSSSKNYLLCSISPIVPFLLYHSIDFNTPLAQPSVSIMWPPRSFNFERQFALIAQMPTESRPSF